jgi:hypothetical protein
MFEKLGQCAENMATGISLSRRGFLGSLGRWAAVTTMGAATLLGSGAGAVRAGQCTAGYKCCIYRCKYPIDGYANCVCADRACPNIAKCGLAGWTLVSNCSNCG